ncbi:MAG: class I SAM-dependent methyltransferase [Lachnospiraceae bacterium]|nr:class I SAM-dependent methyltransferase [Lachnospiraceae bacterium]
MDNFFVGSKCKLKKRIIIYGLGANFKKYYTERIGDALEEHFDVVGMVDKNIATLKNFYQERYEGYNSIPDREYDYICITPFAVYQEIKDELVLQGVDSDRILPRNYWNEFCQMVYFPLDRLGGKGVEIGGPSGIFEVVYNRCDACDGVNYAAETVWNDNTNPNYLWADKVLGNQIIADATDLREIENETYDFVLSSNNLEHIANPLKAISECLRILKPGGVFIILVPCKKYTFDHKREDTSFEHLLADYQNDIGEDDMTHLPEILEKHDLSMDLPAGTIEQFRERSMNNEQNRCLHHHVFSSKVLNEIASYFELDVLENTEFNKNYYLAVTKRG